MEVETATSIGRMFCDSSDSQALVELADRNEDPVSAVDSKHVLLSQASAEVVLASLDQVAEPNPGDEARLILKQMLKDQDEEVGLNLGAKCAVDVEARDTFVLRTP